MSFGEFNQLVSSSQPVGSEIIAPNLATISGIQPDLSTISSTIPSEMTSDEVIDGEIISDQQDPTQEDWTIIPIYEYDQKGKQRIWQIGFDSRTNQLVTAHGHVGGKLQYERREVVPKVNRSMQQQALLEARSRWKVKHRSGYRPLGQTSADIQPQLANEYYPPGSTKPDGKPRSTNISKFPIAFQAKIDGIRAIAYNKGTGVEFKSRGGKVFPWLDHIKPELFKFFSYLPPGSVLDGEMYIHGVLMQTLNGYIHTTNFKHPKNEEIKYYIFDIVDPQRLTTAKRYLLLYQAYVKYVKDFGEPQTFVILSTGIANSREEMEQAHTFYVNQGYEGLMIRHLVHPGSGQAEIDRAKYKGKRNNNLLKFKKFRDEEGTIIDVIDGTGREKGLAIFKLQDDTGKVFPVRPQGTFDERRIWLQNRQSLIGQRYTFKYFERTKDGLPRFPVGVSFRVDISRTLPTSTVTGSGNPPSLADSQFLRSSIKMSKPKLKIMFPSGLTGEVSGKTLSLKGEMKEEDIIPVLRLFRPHK